MAKDISFQIELRTSERTFRWGLACLLLVGCAADLGSESVTLTTYYPAPSGVYVNMITTNNTYLARDGGAVSVRGAAMDTTFNVAGSVRVNNLASCTLRTTAGFVCTAATQYATWTPGVYHEGMSYGNRGGQVLAEGAPGNTTTQVWALNALTGVGEWMTLKKNDSVPAFWCCNK